MIPVAHCSQSPGGLVEVGTDLDCETRGDENAVRHRGSAPSVFLFGPLSSIVSQRDAELLERVQEGRADDHPERFSGAPVQRIDHPVLHVLHRRSRRLERDEDLLLRLRGPRCERPPIDGFVPIVERNNQ